MIDFDNNGPGINSVGGGVVTAAPVEPARGRFRSRLQNKGGLLQPPSPCISETSTIASPRSNLGIGELNRKIIDLKMDNCNNPLTSPPLGSTSPKLTDLGANYPGSNSHYQPTMQTTLQLNVLQQQNRRDSNNSTTSSSYYSMKSSDMSRRSSQQSHTSSISTIRPNNGAYGNYGNAPSSASFYDPISPGDSRRSSQLSTITSDMAAHQPPSSQLLSSHLARLQQYSYYNGSGSSSQYPQHNNFTGTFNENQMHSNQSNQFYNQQQMLNSSYYQNMQYQMTSSNDRRMSEPIRGSEGVVREMPPRPRSTTPTKSMESQKKSSSTKLKDSNEENALAELTDDMLSFLAQVDHNGMRISSGEMIVDQLMTSLDIDKLKEEDLLTFLSEVEKPNLKKEEENKDKDNTSGDTSSQSGKKNNSNRDKDDDDDDTKKILNTSNNSNTENVEYCSENQTQNNRESYNNNCQNDSNDHVTDSDEINNNVSDSDSNTEGHNNCKEDVESASDCSKLNIYKTHASIYLLSMES